MESLKDKVYGGSFYRKERVEEIGPFERIEFADYIKSNFDSKIISVRNFGLGNYTSIWYVGPGITLDYNVYTINPLKNGWCFWKMIPPITEIRAFGNKENVDEFVNKVLKDLIIKKEGMPRRKRTIAWLEC